MNPDKIYPAQNLIFYIKYLKINVIYILFNKTILGILVKKSYLCALL